MNKIIFQIGILGFCIAAVVFGGSGGSVIDIVARSFIVFVSIVIASMMVVLVGGTMLQKNVRHKGGTKNTEQPSVQQHQ